MDYTQRSLLGEADITLAKALDIAQGREAAERNAKSFKNPEVVVQKVVSSTKGAETHHAIVVANQITIPKTAGSERLNAVTVAS